MEVLQTVFYFIIVLSIVIFVHELGHFIAARIFNVKVEKFYVGFDFFNAKIWSFRKGDTEYGIGAIPLGGYVKMKGMIDESMDADFASKPPEANEFRSKPSWQRLIILSAGVIMNFLLAVLIFFAISIFLGVTKFVNAPLDISEQSPFAKMGMQTGDKIIELNGKKIKYFDELLDINVLSQQDLTFKVQKENGDIKIINAPRNLVNLFSDENIMFPSLLIPALVGEVVIGAPAHKAGIMKGDRLISIAKNSVRSWSDVIANIQANKDQEFVIEFLRNQEVQRVSLSCNENGKIGIVNDESSIQKEFISVGFFEAIYIGFAKAAAFTKLTFVGIKKLITREIEVSKSLGGPIKIAKIANKAAEKGFAAFLNFVALISISIGVLNILPVPALDGGHIMVTLIEVIIRREFSVKTKMVIQQVGVALILILMAFVFYNDIVNF